MSRKNYYKVPLPPWVNYTAQDKAGAIWGFQRKPEPNYHEGEWDERGDGEVLRISFELGGNPNWYQTLRHVEDKTNANRAN